MVYSTESTRSRSSATFERLQVVGGVVAAVPPERVLDQPLTNSAFLALAGGLSPSAPAHHRPRWGSPTWTTMALSQEMLGLSLRQPLDDTPRHVVVAPSSLIDGQHQRSGDAVGHDAAATPVIFHAAVAPARSAR